MKNNEINPIFQDVTENLFESLGEAFKPSGVNLNKTPMPEIKDGRTPLKKILRDYLEPLWRHAGMYQDNDTYAEWDALIDGIIEQAKDEVLEKLNGKI